MPRVIGIDPGTLSIDLCGLDDGRRFLDRSLPTADALRDPSLVIQLLEAAAPGAVGLSRQLIGEAAFGASGYWCCGNILAAAGDPQFDSDERLAPAASALATVVSEEFGLVGVNGIDFIARDGVAYPVEVNPRWCGSMELVERVYGCRCLALTPPRAGKASSFRTSISSRRGVASEPSVRRSCLLGVTS